MAVIGINLEQRFSSQDSETGSKLRLFLPKQICKQMKIDIRSDESLYIESGDYTYYLDFSIEGEASLHRFLTDGEDEDFDSPMIIWEDGSDAMQII